MRKNRAHKALVRRYLDNKASDEELALFFDLLRKGTLRKHLEDALQEEEQARRIPRGAWIAMAACLIGLVSVTGWRYWKGVQHPAAAPLAQGSHYSNDVAPGRDHAVLTLAGGKVIDLDSNTNAVALQGGARLQRRGSGVWVYHAGSNNDATIYNTISAPPGGQFPFVLEDGTRIWLNAASSLRFPNRIQGPVQGSIAAAARPISRWPAGPPDGLQG